MTSIADAYVELHVDGDSVEGEVKKTGKDAGKGASQEFDKAGAALGKSMASGFFKGFNIKNRRITRNGAVVGAAFAAGFSKAVSGVGDAVKESLSGIKMPNLRGLGIGAIVAAVPLLTSGISALSGALVAFTGSAAQAAGAGLALPGIFAAIKQGTAVAKIAFNGLSEAMKGTEGAMDKLAPSAQGVVTALKTLTPAWQGLTKQVQGAALAGVGPMLERLGKTTLPTLRAGLTGTGTVLNGVFRDLGQFASSESFVRRLGAALKGNNQILAVLGKAARPILSGILSTLINLQPAAMRLAQGIQNVAVRFRGWANAEGTADSLMGVFNRGWVAALRLWRIVRNLGGTLRNVFGAAVGPGNNLLKTFVQLSGRLRRFTELASTKNAIAEWAQKGIDVSGTLFRGLGKGFKMIAPLFDPAILGNFMDAFGKILPTVVSIFTGIQAVVAPILQKVGDAFAENGPKFAKLFEALGPLLSGIGSVVGELISQTLDFLGGIATVITPFIAVISNFVGPILTKFAPIIATIILAFVNWGSVVGKAVMGFIKFIPVIGRFLAPLIKLASWIIGKIAPAFRGLLKVVGVVFRGIGKVIGGATSFVWGIITRVFGGIGRFIGSVMGVVGRAISTAFNFVRKIVGSVVGGLWNVVKSGFGRVLSFFKSIPDRILNLAGAFLSTGTDLGKKVINGIMDGIKGAGGFVSDLMGSIKGAINSALNLPFTIKGPGPLPDMTIPAFANGTRFAPGGLSLVGERGPELIELPRGSRVHTAPETRRMMEQPGGEGGGNVYIAKMMPHNYSEWQRQEREARRRAALGGQPRRAVPA
jgi:phage-related protein